jgi:hypothetical protein
MRSAISKKLARARPSDAAVLGDPMSGFRTGVSEIKPDTGQ